MAEQSIGMATGNGAAFGDGNVGASGGYASTRMTAMETKTLNDGVLLVGNNLTMSGIGTNTLTISDGAAVVGGYFYENTSSVGITINTLANKTYNVVLFVNATSGPLTVTKSVAGTDVGAYSVRLAVFDGTPAVPYVLLGTVQVQASVIATAGIVPSYAMYATTRQLPSQSYATMSGGTATLTTANTTYDVTAYSSSSVTNDNIFSVNTTTGEITVRRAGLYLVTAYGAFSTGTTGNRLIGIQLNGSFVNSTRHAAAGVATQTATHTALVVTTLATDVIKLAVSASIATQSLASGLLTISRA